MTYRGFGSLGLALLTVIFLFQGSELYSGDEAREEVAAGGTAADGGGGGDVPGAEEPAAAREEAFDRLDGDRSGTLERMEWPGRNQSFQYLDTDHDGVLNRQEFLSRKALWWNRVFEDLDFNANRLIDRSEWLDAEEAFERLDRNRDGQIESREFYHLR
ncbi:MAG: hypothetical protein JXP48_02840 [Acidobacteria bacterium]|nr:hypothetical protein [Acidobacteriota bacterium]